MKKIITIILIALVVLSCTSNESEIEETNKAIVGLWKLTSIKAMNQEFINTCKSKDNIEVRSDKTFTITSHFEDNNCEIQMSSGTWSDNLNSTYKFTALGDTQLFTLTADNKLNFSFQQDSETVTYVYVK